MTKRAKISAVVAMLSCLLGASTLLASVDFAPPEQTFVVNQEAALLQGSLDKSQPGEAASLIDGLLKDHAAELGSADNGGIISQQAWVQSLTPANRSAIQGEYRKQLDPEAATLLDSLRRDPHTRAEDYYGLALRYPLSSSAPTALAAAGDLSLATGDYCSAGVYFRLAVKAGWMADDKHTRLMAAIPPPDPRLIATTGPSTPAFDLIRLGKADEPRWIGPIPFDASWYDVSAAVNQGKFFPQASIDRVFISSWRQVVVLKEGGQPAWIASTTGGPDRYIVERTNGRGLMFEPALLCDLQGEAQIVVVRQPGAGPNDYGLRGLRASDGKQLWTTDGQEVLNGIQFASTPVIAGKYVYGVAVDTGRARASLLLVALDVRSGQLLWRTTLGAIAGVRGLDSDTKQWDEFWQQSPVRLDEQSVYMSPNVGWLIAADRFTGKVNWMHSYPRAPELAHKAPGAKPSQPVVIHPGQPAGADGVDSFVLDTIVATRFTGTPVVCSDAVLSAPQDSTAILSCDAVSGSLLWQEWKMPGTLIGSTGTLAILQGKTIVALSPRDKTPVWTYESHLQSITGPALVAGKTIVVPMQSNWVYLSGEDGTSIAAPAFSVPVIRRAMGIETFRQALEAAGAFKSFGSARLE